MRDLLKEAIADAKAVRETALANAKIALEEAFTPRLQSMISARLREEEEMEEPVTEEDEMEEPVTEEDEEISIEEVIRALREEEEVAAKTEKELAEDEEAAAETEKELAEAIRVIKFLKSKINEVNLLNAKLLFSNKLFRNYPLSESQKVKVIENFDRARTVREVKLVYGTISESLKSTKTNRPMVKESYASRASKSTAPKRGILSEGTDLASRWKKLANLK